MSKLFFFILGMIFLVLAYVGIIMPGIPAIPFILLAGWLFMNSSDRLYNWMLRRRFIGNALRKFNSPEKVSNKLKWFVISQFWVSIIVAQFVFTLSYSSMVTINLVGILGSLLLYRLIK